MYKDTNEIIRIEKGILAIITREVFQQAQDKVKKRKKAPRVNKAKENYILSGLIK